MPAQQIDLKGTLGLTSFADEQNENHAMFAGSARLYLTRRLSIEPEVQYLRQSPEHYDAVFLPSVNWDFRTGRVVPYVTGGAGLLHSVNRNEFSSFSSTEGFLSAGFGVRIYLNDGWFVAPEARVGTDFHGRASVGLGYSYRRP